LAGLYTDQNSFDAKKDEHVSSGGGWNFQHVQGALFIFLNSLVVSLLKGEGGSERD
jgi:hypothetical protein